MRKTLAQEIVAGNPGRNQQLEPVIAKIVPNHGPAVRHFAAAVDGDCGDDFKRNDFVALRKSGIRLPVRPFAAKRARNVIAAGDLELGTDRTILGQNDLRVPGPAHAAVADGPDMIPAVTDLAIDAEIVHPPITAFAPQVGQVEGAVRVDIEPDQSVRG